MVKKSKIKGSKKSYKSLKLIGIIALIVIITIIIAMFLQKDSVEDKLTDKNTSPSTSSECLTINLKVSEIDPNTNILKITRVSGSSNPYKIKVLVNENPTSDLLASDIKEGATKIFIVNTNPGDQVEIAPILRDGTICPVSDSKIA